MSAPTKPPRPLVPAASPTSPAKLTPGEMSALSAYRLMDDDTQQEAEGMLLNLARDFPRRPRLRVIAGGVA